MKVVWTDEALYDLDDITEWLKANRPESAPAVEERIRAVLERIGQWPQSARLSVGRPDVRVVPIGPLSLHDFLSHRIWTGPNPARSSYRSPAMGSIAR